MPTRNGKRARRRPAEPPPPIRHLCMSIAALMVDQPDRADELFSHAVHMGGAAPIAVVIGYGIAIARASVDGAAKALFCSKSEVEIAIAVEAGMKRRVFVGWCRRTARALMAAAEAIAGATAAAFREYDRTF